MDFNQTRSSYVLLSFLGSLPLSLSHLRSMARSSVGYIICCFFYSFLFSHKPRVPAFTMRRSESEKQKKNRAFCTKLRIKPIIFGFSRSETPLRRFLRVTNFNSNSFLVIGTLVRALVLLTLLICLK